MHEFHPEHWHGHGGCVGHGHCVDVHGGLHGHEIHHHHHECLTPDIMKGFMHEIEYIRGEYAKEHPVIVDLGAVDASTGKTIDDLFNTFTAIGIAVASCRVGNEIYTQFVYNLAESVETTMDVRKRMLIQRNASTYMYRKYICTERMVNGELDKIEDWSEWISMDLKPGAYDNIYIVNGEWYINGNVTGIKASKNKVDQWSVGDDGYWYINGNKTEFYASVVYGNVNGSGNGSGCNCGDKDDEDEDPETPVFSSMFKQCYKKSATKPAKPEGGAYSFEDGTFEVPEGWSENTEGLEGEGDVWLSYRTFISTSDTEWSEPARMVSMKELIDGIDDKVQDLLDKMLQDAESDLNKVLSDAQKMLAEAKDKLDAAKDYLDSLKGSWGEKGITEKDIANMTAFSNWYDKNGGTITMLSAELDGLRAEIKTKGEHINTLKRTVGDIEETLSAVKAKAETAATWVDENKQQVNKAVKIIDGMNARIEEVATSANAAYETATSAKKTVDGINATIKLEVSKKVGDMIEAGEFEIKPDQITAAIANSKGAGASIIAAINANNESEVKIDADQIVLDGKVIAELLAPQKIVINGGAAVFNPDGSGYVAGGKISWDKDGNPKITGQVHATKGTTFNSRKESAATILVSKEDDLVVSTSKDINNHYPIYILPVPTQELAGKIVYLRNLHMGHLYVACNKKASICDRDGIVENDRENVADGHPIKCWYECCNSCAIMICDGEIWYEMSAA